MSKSEAIRKACGGSITHELCLMASEHHYTLDPNGVSQTGTSQQQLVRTQWDLTSVQIQRALVRVQTAIWTFTHDFSLATHQFLRCQKTSGFFLRLFDFQIGFSVQVSSLNVAQSFWLRRAEQDQICRERLLAFNSHNVSDSDINPFLDHVLSGLDIQHLDLGPVQLVV
ncbi:hypothetical protein OGAPHI_003044 [Ogataea philodendri]|uniref:Uncharacterized protein n=1 Tax=Ogataea philodendri TaxID=1378263 RepID=A0A9P8P8Y3_9ASCO|nr:uncharacterized protein OGAPHI_003044 [Ogataea philodendri]KAH3667395.1 hypothetical protein OGAPHI_003044 [Ogataea philodendri]